MRRDAGRFVRWVLLPLAIVVLAMVDADANVKPRAILIVPFDSTGLERDEQWMGQGVAEVIGLGLDQHPAFVQIDAARLRAIGRPEAWGEPVVVQAARTLRADAAVFGRITRAGGELVVQPRLVEIKAGPVDPVALERSVIGFLVGQVMKASGGSANPKLAQELLRERLSG